MSEYLAMGGYAGFIWPAYAAAVAILGGMTFLSVRRHRAAAETLAEIEKARKA
ncbi:MAG TPA: heme exporter protein CcmD [Stellaceae bacterium]|nr:heme exporter protein CcmD [Stellaceae bacterium]